MTVYTVQRNLDLENTYFSLEKEVVLCCNALLVHRVAALRCFE